MAMWLWCKSPAPELKPLRLPSTELRQKERSIDGRRGQCSKKTLSLLFAAWAGSEQAGPPEWWLLLWMAMRQIPVAVIWSWP